MMWPAAAYLYLTWPYAFTQALAHARERNRKVWVFKVRINNQEAWMVAWDPKGAWQ